MQGIKAWKLWWIDSKGQRTEGSVKEIHEREETGNKFTKAGKGLQLRDFGRSI